MQINSNEFIYVKVQKRMTRIKMRMKLLANKQSLLQKSQKGILIEVTYIKNRLKEALMN